MTNNSDQFKTRAPHILSMRNTFKALSGGGIDTKESVIFLEVRGVS